MFYRLKEDKTILDCSKVKYADDCLETEKNIIRDFNGKLVFEDETQTQSYLKAKQEFETKQDNKKQIAELRQKLAKYDYIGIKIATGRATKEEYAEQIAQMTEWANEIDKLEGGGNE